MTPDRLTELRELDTTEDLLISQAAIDSLHQLLDSGSPGARFVKCGGNIYFVIVRYDGPRKRESTPRIAELRSKVHHGFNLLASESCEVFAHYGEPIEVPRKRCQACNGEGDLWVNGMWEQCAVCIGTGYEAAIEPQRKRCEACEGTGRHYVADSSRFYTHCTPCNGTGYEAAK